MFRLRHSVFTTLLAAALTAGCAPVAPPPEILADTATTAPLTDSAAAIVRITTADGANLALKHYAAAGAAPVLLLHGLALNAESWDLPPLDGPDYAYRSLVSVLRAAGFDVWLLNFRGHGNGESRSRPAAGQADWTIDHFALYDVPAAVEQVASATGRKPFVIASSLGALALAAWLEGATLIDAPRAASHIAAHPDLAVERQTRLAGAVFVGLPAAMRWPQSPIDEAGRVVWGSLVAGLLTGASDANVVFESAAYSPMLQGALEIYGSMPLRLLRPNEQLEAWEDSLPPSLAVFLDDVDRMLFGLSAGLVGTFDGDSPGRLDVVLAARGVVLEDVEAGVLRQFARSIRARAFVSELGVPAHYYSDHYANIALPTFLVLGGRDRNANADVTRAAFFDVISATDRSIRVFAGLAHGEFEMAPAASALVYPEILAWLAAREPLSTAGGRDTAP